MPTLRILEGKRQQILEVARKHGIRNIRVFGSVGRGQESPFSDVDFLVDLEPGRSLMDLGGLLMDLEALLGCRVDVVTEQGLRPRLKPKILKEAVPL
jgi:hypothetical protein